MPISVTEPVRHALRRTGLILFTTFGFVKWLVLAFCALLAYIVQELSGYVFNISYGGNWQGPTDPMLLFAIALVTTSMLFALLAALTWLQSRGKFMFIDGIVRNRGAVVEPWKEFARLANSFFIFSIIVEAITLLTVVLIGALAFVLALPDINAREFTGWSISAIATGTGLFTVTILLNWLMKWILDRFIAPVMYVRRHRVQLAWAMFRTHLLAGRFWTFVRFFLMDFLVNVAVVILALLSVCLFCGLTTIPYLGTVLLLPLILFARCYSLCFVEQFGPEWKMFDGTALADICVECGYDLRGAPSTGVCPECGTPFERAGEEPPGPPSTPPTRPGGSAGR